MTAPNPIRGLGSYMRAVGQRLHPTRPMTIKDAHAIISYIDEGYAAATLIRLRERGIAEESEGGYIQGQHWLEAASYYGWGAPSLNKKLTKLIDWIDSEYARRTKAVKNGTARIDWIDEGTRVSFSEIVAKAEALGIDTNPVSLRTAIATWRT